MQHFILQFAAAIVSAGSAFLLLSSGWALFQPDDEYKTSVLIIIFVAAAVGFLLTAKTAIGL